MANWYGKARTNFVQIKDVAALKKAAEAWPVKLTWHSLFHDCVMVGTTSDYGGFTQTYPDPVVEGAELEFSWQRDFAPHLADGQVLIGFESGAEHLRYVSGHSFAVTWDGRTTHVDLDDIYAKVANRLKVQRSNFAPAHYSAIPDCVAQAAVQEV